MDDQPDKDAIKKKEIIANALVSPIVRKTFRISLEPADNLSVTINSKVFSIYDISSTGVSILIESDTVFYIGQHFQGCRLNLPGSQLNHLEAYGVHCSPGMGGKWLYGLQWINVDSNGQTAIDKAVETLKKKKFEKGLFETGIESDS